MSLRSTLKAVPTMLRIGFSEAVAYRAELLIWVLATTMPFIMLALWSAVAHEAPVMGESGRAYGTNDFTAYFLATFIVRQLTGSWASWEMNFDVRSGKLAMRLLRPVHPLLTYSLENLAALPMRILVSLPVGLLSFFLVGGAGLPDGWRATALCLASLVGGLLISLFANLAIGTLALFMESSVKVMEVWLAAFFVFSGYLIPVDLFPAGMRLFASYLPFRYQVGLPVELMTSVHAFPEAVRLVLIQWLWVGILLALALGLWRVGLKRFAAYGG